MNTDRFSLSTRPEILMGLPISAVLAESKEAEA